MVKAKVKKASKHNSISLSKKASLKKSQSKSNFSKRLSAKKLKNVKKLPFKKSKIPKNVGQKEEHSDNEDIDEYLNDNESDINSDSEEIDADEVVSNEKSDEDEAGSEEDEAGSEEDKAESDEDEATQHKRDLEKLKESDPDFYKFLQDNDKKLLQFNLSDEEDDTEFTEDIHKPSDNLEVASDESDFEGDNEEKEKDGSVITLKMLQNWQSEIQTDKSNQTISVLTQAFHAALCRISSQDEDSEPSQFKVEGASVFNGVLQLCVLELGPAIRRYLGLLKGSKQPPHKCKKFTKIKNILKTYFEDLLKLLLGVTSTSIQTVLLKHLHYLANMLVSFPNITKSLIKQLIHLWGTSDDYVRVLAFFCILRITTSQSKTILDTVLKSMYLTYVKNSKFVNFKALAPINFMRRSLVEMYSLDVEVSYQHVFLYIRQLAIHLRNAITVKKTENTQAVYNWQFINSLRLWGNLLSATQSKTTMKQLIYPFVQVCLGTMKLVPTAQYYPLRFHVLQILIDFVRDTDVFIPILPFLLEILTTCDFNQKHKKVSMKPMHFTCLLRLSKSQLQENAFKDMVLEMVYGHLLEYMTTQSHTIGFPELSLISIVQIKEFLKKCRNSNYNRKMKMVLEKIQQNSNFIETERSKMTFNLNEFKKIEGWESQIKTKGTPLSTFYENWNKLRTIKKNKQLTNNEELADYKLPVMNKVNKNKNKKQTDGPVELFPSDSEDEDDNVPKKRRGKRGGKNVNKVVADESEPVDDGDGGDIVEDIQMDEW